MNWSSEITHTGPVFSVEVLRRIDAHGRPLRRDVVRHPGAVTIVPVRDDARTLIMIRNHRIAVERALLEFPAGKIDAGEPPRAAAARELCEETGFAARSLTPLGFFFTSPGLTDEKMHIFAASGLEPAGQALEAGEEIEVVEVDLDDLLSMIARGDVVDGKTLGAFLLWRMRAGHRPHEAIGADAA